MHFRAREANAGKGAERRAKSDVGTQSGIEKGTKEMSILTKIDGNVSNV